MTRRKLFGFAVVLVAVVLLALSVRGYFLDFRAFQIANPNANGWEFFVTEKPGLLIGLLVSIGYLLVSRWFGKNVPPVDADMTEFHEKDAR